MTSNRSPSLGRRNHKFDLMRIVFATCVLLSHAPEITDGNGSRELFTRITRSPVTFGTFGVDGFFLLSGFLILRSWDRDPHLLDYLQKRLLRIVPGYMVAAVLSTVVIGLLAPATPRFFHQLDRSWLESMLMLGSPGTPPVLPGSHYPAVNGSMWTIPYEFRCYLFVALFGLCGLVRRPAVWLVTTVILLLVMSSDSILMAIHWGRLSLLIGNPDRFFRLTASYFVGGCFYLFRSHIPYKRLGAIISAAALCLDLAFAPHFLETFLITFGAYLLFYWGHASSRSLEWMERVPDISYGIYLYGWPVEVLWIWYRPASSPWITFLVSTLICFVLGWISWHVVERPMLQFKRRPTAPLPVS